MLAVKAELISQLNEFIQVVWASHDQRLAFDLTQATADLINQNHERNFFSRNERLNPLMVELTQSMIRVKERKSHGSAPSPRLFALEDGKTKRISQLSESIRAITALLEKSKKSCPEKLDAICQLQADLQASLKPSPSALTPNL